MLSHWSSVGGCIQISRVDLVARGERVGVSLPPSHLRSHQKQVKIHKRRFAQATPVHVYTQTLEGWKATGFYAL